MQKTILLRELDFSTIDDPSPPETLPEQFALLRQSNYVPITNIDNFEYTYWDKDNEQYMKLSLILAPPALEIDVDKAIEDYKYYLGGIERSGLTPLSFMDYTFLIVWLVEVINKLPERLSGENTYRAYCMRRMHYAITCMKAGVEYGELDPQEFIDTHPFKLYFQQSVLPD